MLVIVIQDMLESVVRTSLAQVRRLSDLFYHLKLTTEHVLLEELS